MLFKTPPLLLLSAKRSVWESVTIVTFNNVFCPPTGDLPHRRLHRQEQRPPVQRPVPADVQVQAPAPTRPLPRRRPQVDIKETPSHSRQPVQGKTPLHNYPPLYTGWPRKNASLSITNFKEIRDLIKLVSAFMSRTFFFQQNDTKINDFDECVLILEPFFWVNVIFKIRSHCIKSHVWGREEFLWVASPDCNAAKLRNKCFSLFMLAPLYKARADTLLGEAKQWKIFGT